MAERLNPEEIAALEKLRRKRKGVLLVDDVWQSAQDPKSPLHNRYEWDVDSAAIEHWRERSRQLIRVAVTILPAVDKEYRVYASLPSDRSRSGGGYRAVVDIMSDEEHRSELLAQALNDLERWENKYRELEELIPVFIAAEKVKVPKKQPPRKGVRHKRKKRAVAI